MSARFLRSKISRVTETAGNSISLTYGSAGDGIGNLTYHGCPDTVGTMAVFVSIGNSVLMWSLVSLLAGA